MRQRGSLSPNKYNGKYIKEICMGRVISCKCLDCGGTFSFEVGQGMWDSRYGTFEIKVMREMREGVFGEKMKKPAFQKKLAGCDEGIYSCAKCRKTIKCKDIYFKKGKKNICLEHKCETCGTVLTHIKSTRDIAELSYQELKKNINGEYLLENINEYLYKYHRELYPYSNYKNIYCKKCGSENVQALDSYMFD